MDQRIGDKAQEMFARIGVVGQHPVDDLVQDAIIANRRQAPADTALPAQEPGGCGLKQQLKSDDHHRQRDHHRRQGVERGSVRV